MRHAHRVRRQRGVARLRHVRLQQRRVIRGAHHRGGAAWRARRARPTTPAKGGARPPARRGPAARLVAARQALRRTAGRRAGGARRGAGGARRGAAVWSSAAGPDWTPALPRKSGTRTFLPQPPGHGTRRGAAAAAAAGARLRRCLHHKVRGESPSRPQRELCHSRLRLRVATCVCERHNAASPCARPGRLQGLPSASPPNGSGPQRRLAACGGGAGGPRASADRGRA